MAGGSPYAWVKSRPEPGVAELGGRLGLRPIGESCLDRECDSRRDVSSELAHLRDREARVERDVAMPQIVQPDGLGSGKGRVSSLEFAQTASLSGTPPRPND